MRTRGGTTRFAGRAAQPSPALAPSQSSLLPRYPLLVPGASPQSQPWSYVPLLLPSCSTLADRARAFRPSQRIIIKGGSVPRASCSARLAGSSPSSAPPHPAADLLSLPALPSSLPHPVSGVFPSPIVCATLRAGGKQAAAPRSSQPSRAARRQQPSTAPTDPIARSPSSVPRRNTEDEILKAAISKYGKNVSRSESLVAGEKTADGGPRADHGRLPSSPSRATSNGRESRRCSSVRRPSSARHGACLCLPAAGGRVAVADWPDARLLAQMVRVARPVDQEGRVVEGASLLARTLLTANRG